MNASTLLAEKYNFTQTFYTISDKRFLDIDFKREVATRLPNETIKVLRKEIKDIYPKEIENVLYVNALERDGFSFNLSKGYYYGCTTLMLAIQLAYFIGCKNIYILGLDLNYDSKTPRFYEETQLQIDDSKSSVQIFNIFNAKCELEKKNVFLYNCNPNSLARNYIPYQEYNELFSQQQVDENNLIKSRKNKKHSKKMI
ncbi:hypothetical protein BKK51_11220 [Rodentibacter trehalosifermentans]|uniref:Lipopolysaccharide biosynthesis protein n=1 Tax=Rodentibacter trehalosifermentans TaxID=1908263 RepID=A0A1V3INB6_9PAST|nr:hypothetical protein BKK51_11220 [Rodentibacter trehalosifermentans]